MYDDYYDEYIDEDESEYYFDPEDTRQTVESPQEGNGCLFSSLTIPLMIIGIGLLLAWFSSSATTPAVALSAASTNSETALAPLFTSEVQYWAGYISAWAAEAGLDPNLVATVMQIESCGDPRALSGAGATGLFQVMPYHFEDGENPYIPATNALRSVDYLKKSLGAAQGNPRLAFAGYNGGISVISRGEASWATETVRYAYWGSGIYEDARHGASESARLDEWLNHGGASLCAQAHEHLGID